MISHLYLIYCNTTTRERASRNTTFSLLRRSFKRTRHVICTHHFRFENDLNVLKHRYDVIHDLCAARRALVLRYSVRVLKHDSKRHSISRVEKLFCAIYLHIQIVHVDFRRQSQLLYHVPLLRRADRLFLLFRPLPDVVPHSFVIQYSTHRRRRVSVHLNQIHSRRFRRRQRLFQRHHLVRRRPLFPISHQSNDFRFNLSFVRAPVSSSVPRVPRARPSPRLASPRLASPRRPRPRPTSSFARGRFFPPSLARPRSRAYVLRAGVVHARARTFARSSVVVHARVVTVARARGSRRRIALDIARAARRTTPRTRVAIVVVVVVDATRSVGTPRRAPTSVAMARLTEIEDGEAVGIGLAGSELPRRRRKRRETREGAKDGKDGDGVEDGATTRATTTTTTTTTRGTTKRRTMGDVARAYACASVVLALAIAIARRVRLAWGSA